MKDNRKVIITHLPLSKKKADVFAIAKRSRLLINSICEYTKDLKRKGIKVFERYVNIIKTEAGYFCAFYEEDLINNRTEEKKPETFEGFDGRMKIKVLKDGEYIVEDLATVIAMMQIPNPENYEFVKHKDGDVKNNKVENLYWSKNK